MHLLQAVTHQLERFAQALLQRGMQFFIDRAAHLFKLGRVVGLDGGQPLIERATQLFGGLVAVLIESLQLLRQRLLQGVEVLLLLLPAVACLLQLA